MPGAQGSAPMSPMPTDSDTAVVVSVGILPRGDGGDGRIYPLDQFTLDIFVFNQSRWTRRLEVGCPERRRRRRAGGGGGAGRRDVEKDATVGIVPLENRVRVGCVISFDPFLGF